MPQYKYKLEKKIIINARSEEEAQEKLGKYFFISFHNKKITLPSIKR